MKHRWGLPEFAAKLRLAWATARLAAARFFKVDGLEWAAAFAFNAFFSLFPLMILLVTITSAFVDAREAGEAALRYLGDYVPIGGTLRTQVFEVIQGVIQGRAQASALALFTLIWTALQCFTTLIAVTNAAWGHQPHKWWTLPLKSLTLLALLAVITLLAMGIPPLFKFVQGALPASDFGSWSYEVAIALLPPVMTFVTLTFFYGHAPQQSVPWRKVWLPAMCATGVLYVAQALFIVYVGSFASLNALYGAFGGVMALLLWIWVSGCVFIFGACLCAAREELASGSGKNKGKRGKKVNLSLRRGERSARSDG